MNKITLALLIILLECCYGCNASNSTDHQTDQSSSPIADGNYNGRIITRNIYNNSNSDLENISLPIQFLYQHDKASSLFINENEVYIAPVNYEVFARKYPYYVMDDINCFESIKTNGERLVLNKCVYANKISDLGNIPGFIARMQIFDNTNQLKDEGIIYFSNQNLGTFSTATIKLSDSDYISNPLDKSSKYNFSMHVNNDDVTIVATNKNSAADTVSSVGKLEWNKAKHSVFAPNKDLCFGSNSTNNGITLSSCVLISTSEAKAGNKAMIGQDIFCAKYKILHDSSTEQDFGLVCFHQTTG
jgi:hypothetical protein